MNKKNIALILSGGEGKRFDKSKPKQFFKINDQTILEITVEKFIKSSLFNNVIVVCPLKHKSETQRLLKKFKVTIVTGGETRQKSVLNGLEKSKKYKSENIIVHDVVRPFFSKKLLNDILENLKKNKCVIPSLNVYDSVRFYSKDVYKNIERDNLKLIQTPQGFKFDTIYNAHKNANKFNFTDDSLLVFNKEKNILLIPGEILNFKITEKNDLNKSIKLLEGVMNNVNIRTGNGFDVHKFKKGKSLLLFGIKIPFDKSLVGHSDADVGFHSIVDAILGSIGKGDIGEHFPPTEKKWKNKNSLFFLEYANDLLQRESFTINNLDITLICERPKIINYKKKMKNKISNILKIDSNLINIKGTTTEKLGFLGREEGIACQSIVTVSKKNDFNF